MAEKNFDEWNKRKKDSNDSELNIYFYEREVWWCAIGINIGFEQDGKGENFARPVLVLRKYSKNVFIGIPLTTAKRESKYHHSFSFLGATSTALLSQVRLFDSKRLLVKMGRISQPTTRNFVTVSKLSSKLFEPRLTGATRARRPFV